MELAEIFAALLGALAGAGATFAIRRRYEKVQTTIRQFEAYHTFGMAQARQDAWRFLKVDYPKKKKPFQKLWSDIKGSDNDAYIATVRIIYFWFLLDTLKRRGEIIPRLARDMLSYQFCHWRDALEPLHAATREHSAEEPEWMVLLEPGHMDWMDPKRAEKSWLPWRR